MKRRRCLALLAPGIAGVAGCLSSLPSASSPPPSPQPRQPTRTKGPAFPATPSTVRSSLWQQYRHDAASTGYAGRGPSAQTFPLAQTWNADRPSTATGYRYPAIANDTVSAVSSTDRTLVAFDREGGWPPMDVRRR